MQQYDNFIDGQWVAPTSGIWMDSINPYTQEAWAKIPQSDAKDIDLAIKAARHAFTGEWSRFTASKRGHLLCKLADAIEANIDVLAQTEVQDNGKLLTEMQHQVSYLPSWYRYYGGLADKIEGAVPPIDKPDMFNYYVYEPYGVVAAITAWNSPLLLATWKLAPALAAGNTVILKPSEHASVSSLELAKLIEKVGFPPGVVNVITGSGLQAGAPLIEDPRIDKITFTGGVEQGRHIYQTAAQHLTPITLELGGKSPNIVFEDAELNAAADGVISGIFAASGQSCIAGSRLFVQKNIHDIFVDKLITRAKNAKLGDPMQPDTQIGPISTASQFEKIMEYMQIGVQEGAKCVIGGKAAQHIGKQFIEPTIFTHVHNQMRIAQEEIFGPVLVVIPFTDEEEVIQLANAVPFGLAAGLWTQNYRRMLHLPKRLQAGTVWINTYRTLSYLTPFGGYKSSGLGRENGKEAIHEFQQCKSIWINTAHTTDNPFVMH